MSLFLGNISAHIHREELERVFRRFGRCDVQLKEGYGFAIYEVPENAERALRTLRGKQICGENIALDWSRKQPGDFQRFSGPRRFNGPYQGRNFRDKDNVDRMKGPRPYRNFPMQRGRRPIFGHRGHHFDRMDYTREEVNNLGEERGPNFKERMVHKDDHAEANTARIDRWSEHGNGSSDAHAIDNEAEFERYVPSRGLDKRDNNEHNQVTGSDSSPLNASSSDKSRKEYSSDAEHKQLDDSKPQQTCFICGLAGHRMRDCPRVDRPRHDRLERFERRDSEKDYVPRNERGQKRKRSISWSGPDAGKDSVLLRPHSKDGKGSKSQKPRKMDRKEGSPESMKDHHHRLRREDRRKKRKRREIGDSKKAFRKNSRRSRSSNLHSDSFASSSRSKSCSSRSVSGISSRSRSRSPSSRSCSESSSPRSISSFSKSRSSRLRSLSRSLSVSLEHKSSPKDVDAFNDASIKSNMMHASNPESKMAANSNSELQDNFKDKNAYISCKVDVDTYEEPEIGDDREEETFFGMNTGDKEKEEKESSMDMSEKVSFSSAKSLENLGENNYNEAQSGRSSPHFRVGCQDFRYARMSVQEMCRALKNYGLAAPEENEHGLSVGTYFGAGRLWPWEMIYYRRLKRGPITTENYARRIEQNKEFGIIDKFIRSSSGWGEDGRSDE